MENRKQVGAFGERMARVHVERLGWTVLAANFRCRAGEMDLIAEQGAGCERVLVFMEVKTRRGKAHGTPIEAVDARKIARLRQIALAWLSERAAGGEEPACRFDIAEVVWGADGLATVRLHCGIESTE